MLLIQLTGLSGSGKTTVAAMTKQLLQRDEIEVTIVDGDEYRKTLCADLGFSREDRCENIRRLGKVANSFCGKAQVVIIAAISPYRQPREELTRLYGARTVFIHCPLPVLVERDTKGLYRRALQSAGTPGRITNLTGVNDPYEAPEHPDLLVDTSRLSPQDAAQQLAGFVKLHLTVLQP